MLQGARNERLANCVERHLRQFEIASVSSPALAPVARDYQFLRDRGITVRKTIEAVIIGTFSIEGGHRLLHADRDFDPMMEHLGLRLTADRRARCRRTPSRH